MAEKEGCVQLSFSTSCTVSKNIWQLWVLKLSGKKTALVLFYSWVIPTNSDKSGWEQIITEDSFSTANDEKKSVKIELFRVTYYGSKQYIEKVINKLLEGKLISEAINQETTYPPNEILNLKLGNDAMEILSAYKIRPQVFLPIEHILIPWENKAIPSPTDYGCYVDQISFLDKQRLLNFEAYGLDILKTKKTINKISDAFQISTGFNITKESSPRIGNIEWYCFPFSNIDYEEFIKFHVDKDKSNEGASLNVEIESIPTGKAHKVLLVRCRLINGEEVTLDQIKEIQWNNNNTSIRFDSNEPISEVEITVWEKNITLGEAILLFEKHSICLRSIHLDSSIVGTKINTGRINLFTKLRNDERKTAEALASFDRTTKASSAIIGGEYNGDPWVASGKEIKATMKVLFPEKSEGHFFSAGWDDYIGETGQLSFVQWMLQIISGNDKGELILIDPFFDKDGIELFAHTRTTNTKYSILTCTQHREAEQASSFKMLATRFFSQIVGSMKLTWSSQAPNSEPKAANAIRTACKAILPLLNGLNISIKDIRSDEGGKKQLFHDRYILLMDKDNIVIKGFHLSNSIQGATRKAPLLITSIPFDILTEVLSYVENLIDPADITTSSRKTHLIQLFPFQKGKESNSPKSANKQDKKVKKPEVIQILKGVGFADKIFSMLLNDTSIEGIKLSDLQSKLINMEIISADKHSFQLLKLTHELLKEFVDKLYQLKEEEFKKIWTSFSNLLANSNQFNKWEEIQDIIGASPLWGEKLIKLLDGLGNTEKLIGDRNRQYLIFNCSSFEKGIENALIYMMHSGGEFFMQDYDLMYGCEVAVVKFPALSQAFLEKLLTQVSNAKWNEGDSKVRGNMLLINALASNFFSYKNRSLFSLQAPLLSSQNPCIRVVSSASLISAILYNKSKPDTDEVLDLLKTCLPDDEYRLSISALISNLQILNPHRDRIDLIKYLFDRLRDNISASESTIKRIVTVLSGRLYANHSLVITNDLLAPLINTGCINHNFIFMLWNEVFFNKVQYRSIFKTGSSDQFSIHTDVELTNALLQLFPNLDSTTQNNIVNKWIDSIKPMWIIINHPFARYSNYNKFYGCCCRIYWLQIVVKALLSDSSLSTPLKNTINNFFTMYNQELMLVTKFIKSLRYSDVGSLELKQD